MTFLNVDTFKEMCILANNQRSKEIRKNYLMMERVLTQHTTQCLAEQKDMTIKAFALVDEQKAIVLARDEELQGMVESYVRVMKHESVYINKAASELHRNAHKLGMTLDPKKRQSQMNNAHANGTKNVFVQKTSNSRLVEMIVANSIKRYNIGGVGGNEHYNCDIEHTVSVVKVSAAVVDTLVSCRSTLLCNGICDAVIDRMREIKHQNDSEVSQQQASARAMVVVTSTPTQAPAPQESKLKLFLSMSDDIRKYSIVFGHGGVTSVIDLEKAFERSMFKKGERTGYRFNCRELALIQSYGCHLSSKAQYMCMTCHNVSKSGCCSDYSQTNRRKKMLFFDMTLRSL